MSLHLLLKIPGRLSLVCLAVITVCQLGCSNSGGYEAPEELVEVKGKVVLDGEPLIGATMSFIPDKGTEGTGGFAVTDETGGFKALHYSQAEGLQPGNYKVVFSKLVTEDGNPIPEGVDAADVGAVEKLPSHLVQVHSGNHQVLLTVNQSAQEVEYKLNSKRGRRM